MIEGILAINKPKGLLSFRLVSRLRFLCKEKKIGHTGTLDPFATGVMVLLIGKNFTRMSDQLIAADKEYIARVYLGKATDTYDCDGQIVSESPLIPSLEQIKNALVDFNGSILQTPPMFSAKKVQGKKLYELARQGKEIERKPCAIHVKTELLEYAYPYLDLKIECSKGTYIRSIAYDLGVKLGCGAYLEELQRTRSGHVSLNSCLDGQLLFETPNPEIIWDEWIKKSIEHFH